MMDSKGKKKILTIIISIFVLFTILFFVVRAGSNKKKDSQAVAVEEYRLPVKLSKLTRGVLKKHVNFNGTVTTDLKADLRPKMSGMIDSILVDEGDEVSQGQVLIQLDDDDLQAQLDQAMANLASAKAGLAQASSSYDFTRSTTNTQVDMSRQGIQLAKESLEQAKSTFNNAKADYNRMKNLYERGAISKQNLDQATTQYEIARSQFDSARVNVEKAEENLKLSKANTLQQDVSKDNITSAQARIEQAQAAIEMIKVSLDYCKVRSPIDGTVIERNAEPGEIIAPGDKSPALVVMNSNIVQVDANVPEAEIFGLAPGQEVEVFINAISPKPAIGVIETILPSADPTSRSFRVKVSVPNPKGLLVNGMSAMVRASVGSYTGIVVPRHWLVQIEGDFYVTYPENRKIARQKKVKVVYYDEESACIENSLKPGMEVITTGQENLKDGDPIKVLGYENTESSLKTAESAPSLDYPVDSGTSSKKKAINKKRAEKYPEPVAKPSARHGEFQEPNLEDSYPDDFDREKIIEGRGEVESL